jgi:hypothetical protein
MEMNPNKIIILFFLFFTGFIYPFCYNRKPKKSRKKKYNDNFFVLLLYMPIPIDKDLYNKVKEIADNVYKKNSAYKSMYIQKLYKKYGGEYEDDGEKRKLTQWKNEEWRDIGNKEYPVYRPTLKISKDTPLLVSEIDPTNLQKQIKLKQQIKGNENLPKFKPKK